MNGQSDCEAFPATRSEVRRTSRAGLGSGVACSPRLSGWPALAFVAMFVGALLGTPRAAEAFEILASDTQRTIFADALTTQDLEFSIETNGDGEPGLLIFDASVLASAPLVDVSADADADQQSQIELTELTAAGLVDASGSIAVTATDASMRATGESIYRVVFSVDVATTFVLSGHVEGSALPAIGDTFAIVELIDFDTLTILFSFTESDGGRTDFSEVVMLVPGVNYELYASGIAIAEALTPGTTEVTFASYSVNLVPEPATLSGILAGCGALGLLARRRRSRPL